jgi:gamma-glutamyltranspeptidase/glutathione hydrolase
MFYDRLFLAALVLSVTSPLAAQIQPPTRSPVYAPNGVIATSQPLATGAGLAVLERGGNAVDAAVTAAAVLNVVEPHMTGMGGDLFALVWLAGEKRLVGINASGRSGALMTRDALIRRGHDRVPYRGAKAITVPGALAGWEALLERHGTLSLAEALRPAIDIAREGFPVSPIIAGQWAAELDVLRQDPGASATFLVGGERAPEAGEWFRKPDLANSLQLVADRGPGVLYGGELGESIVGRVQELGGFLTIEDLRAHRVDWVQPISADFRGLRLWELPPNGQGIAALEMLRILEPFDLTVMGHNTPAYLHHLIEAKKLAFADLERFVGDPAYTDVPVDRLLSDEFIADRRSLLDPTRAADVVAPGEAFTSSETIYLTAADAQGNMVSFINSIYEAFGSGIVVPGTGFALQNRGAGFTLELDHPNTVVPGKRPFHTIIPAFVTRITGTGEEPWMSFGVMGGSMQPQGHVQVLLNMLLFDMDVQRAIDAPRFRHLDGRTVALEEEFDEGVLTGLRALGHEVVTRGPGSFGGAQAVIRLERGWVAGSDPRKDGMAAGR